MGEKIESDLVRVGVTRFPTTFPTLQRLHNLKEKLINMYTPEEWLNLKTSKEVKEKIPTSILLQVLLWKDVIYALKVLGLL